MKRLLSPHDIVHAGMCIGCGSCVAQADDEAKMDFDEYGQLKPVGSKSWLHQPSDSFSRTCPFSPVALNEDRIAQDLYASASNHLSTIGYFQSAYVGHVAENDFRFRGSSGGMVSWVAAELLKHGLIDGVAHVVPTEAPQEEGRFFKYRISRTIEEINEGAKSRYYPVEMSGILQLIKNSPGKYAVVGIPCFIKAIQLLRKEDPVLLERIAYTLGLFCGHMKSARFVESFAWQMNVPFPKIKKVEFRHKDPNRPANLYNAMLTLHDGTVINKDWWHMADGDWGAGFFMNSACNYCDDVVSETADISFGDAWVEPYSSDGRGTNVVVVRSQELNTIVQTAISEGRLQLETVTGELVAQTQAAGLRQRREGLGCRLIWRGNTGVTPVKRVLPNIKDVGKSRRKIYKMRFHISAWSHRIFRLARLLRQPQIYIRWARVTAAVYHGLAYHKGKLGEMFKRLDAFK